MLTLYQIAEDLPFSNPDRGWMRSLALAALLHGAVIGGVGLINGWGMGEEAVPATQEPLEQELEAEMVIVPVVLTEIPALPSAPVAAPKMMAEPEVEEPIPEPVPEPAPEPAPELIPEPVPEVVPLPAPEPPPRPKPPVAPRATVAPRPMAVQVAGEAARPAPTARSAPAVQGGPSVGVVHNWHQLLAAHLERHKTYPRQARLLRQQGVVAIKLTLDGAGQVLSVALQQTSGSPALDAATLDLARRASPLPPPPAGMTPPVTLVVPLRYQLH